MLRVVFLLLIASFTFSASRAWCAPGVTASCERRIQLRLVQASSRDGVAVFELPVSCAFFDEVNVGDDLLRRHFQWGSFAQQGAMEFWSLEVSKKYLDNPTYQGERCEKMLVAGLSQEHLALEFWEHAGDRLNRTKLQIPVGCDTYRRVAAGENLIRAVRSRDRSLSAAMGGWRLRVIGKRDNAGSLD